jgi:hypothetical protein
VFALNAVRKQAYRFFWLTHQAGGRFLGWKGVTRAGRALHGTGGRYLGWKGVTWAGRALPGLGGRYLGWEGASWVRRAISCVDELTWVQGGIT